MDFTSIGTVNEYARSLKTAKNVASNLSNITENTTSPNRDTAHFSRRAAVPAESEAPAVKPNSDTSAEEPEKTISEMVREQMEKIDSICSEKAYDKSKDNKLIGIKGKLRSGLRLTISEQQYLAIKDPDTYSSFQKTEISRKMFRCTLNSCRTKDQVNGMRLSNALSALSEYRKAIRNGGDGSAIVGLNAALENEIRDFVKSPGFKRLPTVAECNKFDRDLAKARKYEQEKKLAERRKLAKRKKKLKKTPGDGKRTVAQVLATPTARKVLGSRAKSTYCACSVAFEYTKKMNSKA